VNQELHKILSRQVGDPFVFKLFDRFEAELPDSGDERAMVLITTSLIEQLLEEVILTYCVRRFCKEQRNMLLGSGPEGGAYGAAFREDLDRMRRIRNVFAHAKMPITFNSSSLRGACNFHVFDSRISKHKVRGVDTPAMRFLQAGAIMAIVLAFLKNANRRTRPRARKNATWVYAEPPAPINAQNSSDIKLRKQANGNSGNLKPGAKTMRAVPKS
jgi:hypothetical protein